MEEKQEPSQALFAPDGKVRLDLMDRWAEAALRAAVESARQSRWDCIRTPHIFLGLLAKPEPRVRYWGELLRADLTSLRSTFQELFYCEVNNGQPVLCLQREFLSDNVIQLLRHAQRRAMENRRPQIDSMDLLISILTARNNVVVECFERMPEPITAARLTELAVIAEHKRLP
ncbi:MAG: hypothetical protein KatS3mg105_0826 [Gemmatales bacterium]|nr:MAG: hypothetical protein KatS3mg105_0826 [Gemmatales bacterium]